MNRRNFGMFLTLLISWFLAVVAGGHARAANVSITATPAPVSQCDLNDEPCLGPCQVQHVRDARACLGPKDADRDTCTRNNQQNVAACKTECRRTKCLINTCWGRKECEAECDKTLEKCLANMDKMYETCLCGTLAQARTCCANQQLKNTAVPSPPAATE